MIVELSLRNKGTYGTICVSCNVRMFHIIRLLIPFRLHPCCPIWGTMWDKNPALGQWGDKESRGLLLVVVLQRWAVFFMNIFLEGLKFVLFLIQIPLFFFFLFSLCSIQPMASSILPLSHKEAFHSWPWFCSILQFSQQWKNNLSLPCDSIQNECVLSRAMLHSST